MAYGTVKADSITFTSNSADVTTTLSGIYASTTNNLTLTGTASAVTFTGTTANFVSGVFSTQVSGATVIAPTGTFTSLTGTTATFTSGIIASGTAALPSLAILSDPNTGIFSPGADQLAVATNGTQRLTVDTAATTSTLPVVHPLGAVGTPSITFTGDLNTGIYSPTADTLAFVEGGAEAMRIDSGGSLVIGTSQNPTTGGFSRSVICFKQFSDPNSGFAGIHIEASGDQSVLGIGYNGTTNAFEFDTSYRGTGARRAITFKTTGAECARIDTSGNFGIGTTTPDALLTVNGIGAFGDGAVGTPSIANTGDLNTGFWFPAADTIAASTGGSERARIDSSGRLLVGTSSATANGGVLELSGGITFPATAVAASNANTLDDYEEGTWTPVVSFGGASVGITGTFSGTYTKVGNVVTVTFRLVFTSKGSSTGNMLVSGMPFNAGGGNETISGFGYAHRFAFLQVAGQMYLQLDGTDIYPRFFGYNGGSTTALTNTDIGNSTDLRGGIVFRV